MSGERCNRDGRWPLRVDCVLNRSFDLLTTSPKCFGVFDL